MDLTDEEVTMLLLLARLLQAGPVDSGREFINPVCTGVHSGRRTAPPSEDGYATRAFGGV